MNKIFIWVDGSTDQNPGPSGVGAIIKDDKGNTLSRCYKYIDRATNNEAEYEAVISGLNLLDHLFNNESLVNIQIIIHTDSRLVFHQLCNSLTGTIAPKGELTLFKIKKGNMKKLNDIIRDRVYKSSLNIKLKLIKSKENSEAHWLANEARENMKII